MYPDAPNDLVQQCATEMCAKIVREGGADDVRAVWLSGSAAAGDVAVYPQGDLLEIHSDIDMHVRVREGAEETIRALAADVCKEFLSWRNLRFVRNHDIGIYTGSSLRAQPARPGTVGLPASARRLHGDAAEESFLPAWQPADIPVVEALRLIENRVTELSLFDRGATTDELFVRRRRFLLIKLGIDVGAAHLIAGGQWSAGRSEQSQRVRSIAGDTGEVVRMAHAMRDDVQGSLGADRPWEHPLIAAALATWQSIAAPALGIRDADDWGALLSRRCRAGAYAHNFREFVAVSRRGGRSRPGAAWAGLHLVRFSPVNALRVAALTRRLREVWPSEIPVETVDALNAFLDRLSASAGFTTGTLAERSLAMFESTR